MAEKKLSPELRFPGFENNWIVKKYEEIYSFKPTNSFSREKLNYEKGTVRNIHYGDIHTKFNSLFYLTQEQVPFINEEINISRIPEECYLKEGDLVVADASENYEDIGKTIEIANLNEEKVVAGLHTFLARRKSGIMTNGFASFLMKTTSVRRQVKKIAQGTKVLGIASKRLSKVLLIIPQPEEQQKIASFLTVVDRRIQLLQKKKGKLEEYKKGIMQKLFSQKIRFKDENGNDFPHWKEKRLGEVTKYYDGTHQTPKYVEKGIPFYSVEHVTANQFSKTKFISQQIFEKENERVKLEKGDILMTRIGSIGTAKYIDWDVSASFYVSLALIKQKETFNSKFLSYCISHSTFQKELWKRTIHVAFPKKINLGEIGECLVQLPSLPEQQNIALFLSSLDRKIEQVGLQIEKTQAWKKGLLKKMFV